MTKTKSFKRPKTVRERVGVHLDQETRSRFKIPLTAKNLLAGIQLFNQRAYAPVIWLELYPQEQYHMQRLIDAGLVKVNCPYPKIVSFLTPDAGIDWESLPYYDVVASRREKLYLGQAMDISGFKHAFYHRNMRRLLTPSEAEQSTDLLAGSIQVYEFPPQWRQGWVEADNLDYYDAAGNHLIRSIAYEYRSGRIVASKSSIFYEVKDDFRLLWLR